MLINILIVVLTMAFVVMTYYQNALYSTDMHWEKRSSITTNLAWMSSIVMAIDSYLISRKTEMFFKEYHWIDLCLFYYMIGFIFIQMTFFVWGKWKMNKYHESKMQEINKPQ